MSMMMGTLTTSMTSPQETSAKWERLRDVHPGRCEDLRRKIRRRKEKEWENEYICKTKNNIISSTWYQTSSLHRRQKREVAWYNSRKSWYQLRSLVIMWYFNLLNHKLPYDTNLVWIWVDLERESLGGQWPGAGRDPDVEKDRPLLLIDQSAPPTPNLVHLNLILPHFSDCAHTHQQIQIRNEWKYRNSTPKDN